MLVAEGAHPLFVCRATPVGTTKILTGVEHGYPCGFSCDTQKALYFHPFLSSGLSGEVDYDEDRGFGAWESWDGWFARAG